MSMKTSSVVYYTGFRVKEDLRAPKEFVDLQGRATWGRRYDTHHTKNDVKVMIMLSIKCSEKTTVDICSRRGTWGNQVYLD